MAIAFNGKRAVAPTHPGKMLREDFIPDHGLTVAGLASAPGVSRQSVKEVLGERRAVSPETALRLSQLCVAVLVSCLLLAATTRIAASGQVAHADISLYGVGMQCPFAKVGVALSCRVVAEAYPPRTLSFRLEEGPSGLEIGEKTGDFTWLPTLKQLGRHKVTVSARDDAGGIVRDTSWILVLLPPPADFQGKRTPEGVLLSWAPVPGAVSYRIRRLNSGERIAEVTCASYLDAATVPAEDSSYAINAVDSLGHVGGDEWLHLPEK